MMWYCSKCKKMHNDDELCPSIQLQLKKHPEWLHEVADFVTVAGEEALITSQALDHVAQQVNNLVGTNLAYEGTSQFARDVQVFQRLNTEAFSRSGAFSTPENAKAYFENVLKVSETTPRAFTSFESKLTGYGQEADWLRWKQGQISSLWEKSYLLDNNAAGVDGITVNRFTGKEISRTTIKASINPMSKNSTGIQDVQEAIAKGTATGKDVIYGPAGTSEAARNAGLNNPVVEHNTAEQIQESNRRLGEKISNNQAYSKVPLSEVGRRAAGGAIIGAAVAITISSITSYTRYKNGELTRDEAFREVSEDTVKGAIVGAGLSAVSIFLPGGAIGFIAGMAIGVYINKVCSNILDEIYGKGAYGAILDASGYVYGTTHNLGEQLKKLEQNAKTTHRYLAQAKTTQAMIEQGFDLFEEMKER